MARFSLKDEEIDWARGEPYGPIDPREVAAFFDDLKSMDDEDDIFDPEYTAPHPATLLESSVCFFLCVGYAAFMVWASVHLGGPTR